MTLTNAIFDELLAEDSVEQRLSQLGELTLRYTPRTRLWHASCTDVMITDGHQLYPMSTCGSTPQAAIDAYWQAVIDLPLGHHIVTNAWRADKQHFRWNAATLDWTKATL
jgi:hypothetical protein